MGDVIDFEAVVSARAEKSFKERWSPRLGALELAAELPPIPWVCEELGIAPGSVTIVGGAGFGGKTMSMQSFLLSVASGKKAWGQFPVKRGRVVHIDYEQGSHLTVLRYQRLARSMGVDLRALEGLIDVIVRPRATLDDESAETELAMILEGATIAIVDAFRGAFPSAKENDSGVRWFLDMLARVSEKTGCAIVVIAHSRKMNDDVDVRSSLRGSGALFDAAQTVYMLDGQPNGCTHVNNTKDRILGETRKTFGLKVRDEVSWCGTDRRWGLTVEYITPEEIQAQNVEAAENLDVVIAMNAARIETLGNRVLAMISGNPGITRLMIKSSLYPSVPHRDVDSALQFLARFEQVRSDGRGPTESFFPIES